MRSSSSIHIRDHDGSSPQLKLNLTLPQFRGHSVSHRRPRFVLGWGVIAEGQVTAPPIIEHLDVLEDVLCRVFTGRVVPMVYEFALSVPKKLSIQALSQQGGL